MNSKMLGVVATIVFLTGLMGTFISMGLAAPIDIKLTTIQLKQQQMGIGIEQFAKYAQESLKDKVRVRTYPAAQLYTGQEEVQAVIKGELQMAFITASALYVIDPAMQLSNLPYLAPDVETAYAIFDGPVGKKLSDKMEKKGIAILGAVSSGKVILSNNKRPVKSVEDVKGLKMRSFGTMGAATLKALGAISVVTASEETYSALQQGVIDGATTPANVFLARKYYDVQKYTTDPGMLNATFAYLIANAEWWKKLPVDVRAGLTNVTDKLIKEMRADIEKEDKTIFQQIVAKGCQNVALTPSQIADWKKALQPVYKEFANEIGPDLIKEAQQNVAKAAAKIKK